MKAFPIRTAMVALALIASFLFAPVNSNAQVKSAAAAMGFKAAKIAVVFNDVVKLSDSIQKVGYRPDENPSETVKTYIANQFEADGVEVTDEAGEHVADITFYIGVDDIDDDNDGKADTTDDQDFTNEAPADVKDSDIERVDLDEKDAHVREMPDTVKNQGIYVCVVNHTTGETDVFSMDADVLGEFTASEASPSASTFTPRNARSIGEANHAIFRSAQQKMTLGQWASWALKTTVSMYTAPFKKK